MIKDNLPVGGEPVRLGSAAVPEARQDKDHPVVARLLAAGAVVVGHTNLPERGIYPFTDSAFGIARNPWDRRRSPGGSPGGSAAVASAMVPVAQGNDGLGAIRIPAGACGLVGIKPGVGVVLAQIGADSWGGIAENGPLATTVADAALMLEVMAGVSFDVTEPSSLRIAVSVKPAGRASRCIARSGRRSGSALTCWPDWGTPRAARIPRVPGGSRPRPSPAGSRARSPTRNPIWLGPGWNDGPVGMSARVRS